MRGPLWGLAILLVAGCASPTNGLRVEHSEVHHGLIQWRRKNIPLTLGEVSIHRSAEEILVLRFSKQPPFPALTLRLGPDDTLVAAGQFPGKRWDGPWTSAPEGLATWAKFLADYRNARVWPDGRREFFWGNFHTVVSRSKGITLSLVVTNILRRETVAAAFQN